VNLREAGCRRTCVDKARRGLRLPRRGSRRPYGTRFLNYFRQDELSGKPKAVVAIDLEVLR
jgi:hypothetical protein